MNCPKCFEPLRIAERQGVEIDYCPECRGVWLDKGELDKIIDRSLSYKKPDSSFDNKNYEHEKYKTYKKKKKKAKHFLEDIFDIFD